MNADGAATLLARARATILRLFDGADDTEEPTRLGEIRLRPTQRDAIRRVRHLVARHGGAMLADPVGIGKTFVALAVARRYVRVTVAAPAALRGMWESAAVRAGVAITFVSYEQLSRGRTSPFDPEFVILDEAHHLRNPAARRYAAAAAFCRRAPCLLLSATPLQNRVEELAAQLALFLGDRADSLGPHELARFVVRRADAEPDAGLPRLDGPHALPVGSDDDCLDLLLALPPPVPAADEGDGGALLLYSLVQQWASSRAALGAALRRRLARAMALASALEDGHVPTRAELSAWSYGDDAVQLAFTELIVSPRSAPTELLESVRAHERALRATLEQLGDGAPVDHARAEALRGVRTRHRGERILVFSQYAETVRRLGGLLAPDGGIAWLTARGGRIASGAVTRREVLAQFAPGAIEPARAERIELLVTTDVLSEGLNLQEASVVVHLDLPWNPARLEQRVGRVRRSGSRHSLVTAYTFAPPASAERLLRLNERLRDKLALARRTIGGAAVLLPVDIGSGLSDRAGRREDTGEAEEIARVRAIVRRWRSPDAAAIEPAGRAGLDRVISVAVPTTPDAPVVAAVRAARRGFLACIEAEHGEAELVVEDDGSMSTRPGTTMRTLEAIEAATAVAPDPERLVSAVAVLRDWWMRRVAAEALDLAGAAATTRARREGFVRVQRIHARAPRHQRARLADLVTAARAVLGAAGPRGAEQELAALIASPLDDEAWLRAIAATGATMRARGREVPTAADPPVRAIILFQPAEEDPVRP